MRNCPVYKCCTEKGLEHCGFCSDFLCEKIKGVLEMEDALKETHPDLVYGWTREELMENIERRKKVGTEKWLEEQKSKEKH